MLQVVAQFPDVMESDAKSVEIAVKDIQQHQDRTQAIAAVYFDTAGGCRVVISGSMRLNQLCRVVCELQADLNEMLQRNDEYNHTSPRGAA